MRRLLQGFTRVVAVAWSVGIVTVLGYGHWMESQTRADRDAETMAPAVVLDGKVVLPDSARGRVWVQTMLRQHRIPRERPAWLTTGVRQAVADGLWMRDSVGREAAILMRVGMMLQETQRRVEQPYRFEREDRDTWRGIREGAHTGEGWPDTLMAHRREHEDGFPLPGRTSTVSSP